MINVSLNMQRSTHVVRFTSKNYDKCCKSCEYFGLYVDFRNINSTWYDKILMSLKLVSDKILFFLVQMVKHLGSGKKFFKIE